MNQGYFFQLEKNSSQADGTVIFRYMDVKVIDKDAIKKYSIPEYPIYLVIKSTAIDFYFHGISPAKEDIYPPIGNKINANSKENHVNIRILHLPLSKNIAVKDNLTSILLHCYHLKYTIHEIYECHNRLTSENEIVYSNLIAFNSDKCNNREDHVISFKKLFLDFLFDLEHSKVFENSPHYEEAEIHLIENVFFHKIALKASFCYQCEQFIRKKGIEEQLIPGLNLVETEKQWIENCLDSRSSVLFEESEGWFEPVETEVKNILFRKERKRWLKLILQKTEKTKIKRNKSIDEKILINSSKWYLRRYNFLRSIHTLFLLFSQTDRFFILFLLISFLSTLSAYVIVSNSKLLNSTLFVLSCLCFIGLHIYLIAKKIYLSVVSIFLPRLIIGLSGAWFFILTTEELVLATFDQNLNLSDLVIMLCLLSIIFLFIMIQIKSINKANLANSYLFHIIKLAVRSLIFLILSILTSIIIGFISTSLLAKKTIECSQYLKTYFQELTKARYDESIYSEIEKTKTNESYFTNTELFNFLEHVYCKPHQKTNFHKILFLINFKLPFTNDSIPVYIFPRMLIYLSVFALFFGVFIQLIFEDKPVTEPL